MAFCFFKLSFNPHHMLITCYIILLYLILLYFYPAEKIQSYAYDKYEFV